MQGEESHDSHVLSSKMSHGPKGLGDPDDLTMRSVEANGIIPRRGNKRAMELCDEYVQKFNECGKREGWKMPFTCRAINKARQACMKKVFDDPAFLEGIRIDYLEERSEYRRTGISRKKRLAAEAEAAAAN